jgi:flavin reductase (DIM6/NTAB) family NADH-FMN oxidoreductase RutF
MDEDAKETALRMIPYGMVVLTSKAKEGQEVGAATINWITQTSFLLLW